MTAPVAASAQQAGIPLFPMLLLGIVVVAVTLGIKFSWWQEKGPEQGEDADLMAEAEEAERERLARENARAQAPDWGPRLSRRERTLWWLIEADLRDEDEDEDAESRPW